MVSVLNEAAVPRESASIGNRICRLRLIPDFRDCAAHLIQLRVPHGQGHPLGCGYLFQIANQLAEVVQ